jgi:hypothetical protein
MMTMTDVDFALLHSTMVALRNDIANLDRRLTERLDDVNSRLTTLEVGQAGILQFISHHDTSIALQQAAFDRLTKRVDRIERRLDLSETP